MSFNNLPSKVEVMGWNPQSLADYMRKLKLSGCDKVVMRGNISGTQFMKMTECDIQVFPIRYVPIITKIQGDITKGERKRAFGHKPDSTLYIPAVPVREEEAWNSEESDNDSDCEDSHHMCALTEPEKEEQQDSDKTSEEIYELPPSEDTMELPQQLRVAKLQDDHNRASQRQLHIERSKKPGKPCQSQRDSSKSICPQDGSTGSLTRRISRLATSKSTDKSNRASKLTPAPPLPTQPAIGDNSSLGPRGGLDLSWYGGEMTRHQAEVVLKEVNKDGAFVVRDSSKGSTEHPYTLMLLKQGRVYNIKIRNQGNSYYLGTGLTNKSFPGVKEMITHHKHTPLLLIDATDQSLEAQRQCCLLHPAGP